MSIGLADKLVETAQKVAVTKNEYGDDVWGSTTSVACLYRDISRQDQLGNREEVTYDGILWFGADATVELGDIYYHPVVGYLKIVGITVARRRLIDNSIAFIRTTVQKVRQVS